MIIAAHQPSYLPWLGYLDKIARVDRFIVMDDLQYEAQNFQNRNRVKLAQGPAWLTVPVLRGPQTDRVVDKRIDNTGGLKHHWQRKTLRTLQIHYGAAPHFDRYASDLEDIFTRRWHWLVDLDLHILDLARRWFGITTPILRSSTLGLRGNKTDRIVALCEAMGATTYLSGRGGSTEYLDVDVLARAGVTVAWQDFAHPIYPQRYPGLGFVSHLAFLDRILNCGAQSAEKEKAA
jgi:hypothetical protein